MVNVVYMSKTSLRSAKLSIYDFVNTKSKERSVLLGKKVEVKSFFCKNLYAPGTYT